VNSKKPIFLLMLIFMTMSANVISKEVLIPRSVAGDKGKYFLIEKKKTGKVIKALHKRVGVDSVGYTLTETNCSTMKMRELGYSEISASSIKQEPTKWFDLVPGSSKSDLAKFVCK
jgi:tryptophanase